jgi:hypothetical protein
MPLDFERPVGSRAFGLPALSIPLRWGHNLKKETEEEGTKPNKKRLTEIEKIVSSLLPLFGPAIQLTLE